MLNPELLAVWGLGDVPPDWSSLGLVALRATVLYVIGLLLIRGAKNRLIGTRSGFDFLVAFMLASLLAAPIDPDQIVLHTLVGAAVLVGLHAAFGAIAHRSDHVERWLKGDTSVAVRDGVIDDRVLAAHHISEDELREAIHRQGLQDFSQVSVARLERGGRITVVPKYRIVEVDVQEGVQRVRIEI